LSSVRSTQLTDRQPRAANRRVQRHDRRQVHSILAVRWPSCRR